MPRGSGSSGSGWGVRSSCRCGREGEAAAVIAAVAAVVGGLLAAFATRSVERLRLRASLLEKAQERRLAGIEDFMLATSLWVDWLTYR